VRDVGVPRSGGDDAAKPQKVLTPWSGEARRDTVCRADEQRVMRVGAGAEASHEDAKHASGRQAVVPEREHCLTSGSSFDLARAWLLADAEDRVEWATVHAGPRVRHVGHGAAVLVLARAHASSVSD